MLCSSGVKELHTICDLVDFALFCAIGECCNLSSAGSLYMLIVRNCVGQDVVFAFYMDERDVIFL